MMDERIEWWWWSVSKKRKDSKEEEIHNSRISVCTTGSEKCLRGVFEGILLVRYSTRHTCVFPVRVSGLLWLVL